MAPKKPTTRIPVEEFPAWLKAKIGDQSITDFATSIGFKRQRLSSILNGREQAGTKLLLALKKHGLRRAETFYVVDAD